MGVEEYYPCFYSYVSINERYLLDRRTSSRFILNEATWSLVESINGRHSIQDLIEIFGEESEDVLRYLHKEQLIYFSKAPKAEETSPEYQLHAVNIEITYGCNLRCLYCYNSSGEPLSDELTASEWIKALKLLKKHGVSVISFIGGEPLVKNGIWKILSYAVENFKVNIISNGWLLADILTNREHINILKKIWMADISLDSMNPSIHDALRGYGSHVRALRSIILLKSLNIPVEISTVHHILNYDEREIVEFSNKLGVPISYSGFECRGRARTYNLDFLIPEPYRIVREGHKEKGLVMCPALYGELTLQPNGYFKPCLQPSEFFENIAPKFTRSFHVLELESKSPRDINFIKTLKTPYISCPNSKCKYFNEVCGLCLVLRYYYNKAKYCEGMYVESGRDQSC